MYIKALQLTIWLIEERHYIILGNDSTNVWMYTAMAVTSTSILCWISMPNQLQQNHDITMKLDTASIWLGRSST